MKDPERNRWRAKDEDGRVLPRPEAFHFSKREVWESVRDDSDKVVCRGLIEDWETWRLKSNGAFKMLTCCPISSCAAYPNILSRLGFA